MSPLATFRMGLCVAIVAAICQTALAETMPGHPDYSWLFDEGSGVKAAAHSGGHDHDGTLATGAAWSTDTPFHYAGDYSLCVTNGEVSARGLHWGQPGPSRCGRSVFLWTPSLSPG